jgi:hypothetical protein
MSLRHPQSQAVKVVDTPAAPTVVVQVTTSYRGTPLDTRLLRAGTDRDTDRRFRVGSRAGADAPLPAGAAPEDPFELVGPADAAPEANAGFVLHVAPGMEGELRDAEGWVLVENAIASGRRRFALPPGARAWVSCGEVTFEVVASEGAPAPLPRPRWTSANVALFAGALFTMAMAVWRAFW